MGRLRRSGSRPAPPAIEADFAHAAGASFEAELRASSDRDGSVARG
ncbi:MAG TPA: hypothetical protein H9815_06720 [Candidatus Ruania gallistercoris]|uniref:Uncharacterized protein n=1 Tax=Candidatus Ruania gallistercoris TaxID=2838746 RepID=A0A9D2J3S8_9MICO|nr:hypothetical protein [Candidatus Ruania gallistercoris]